VHGERAENSEPKLRVGAVSYLNTRPLVYRLEDYAPDAELVYDVPSRLADQLDAGTLDVALVPSVEYLQHPTYSLVSDACIACRGPVLSVKLLSRVPVSQIRTLALDEGSRTSVALVRILLKQRCGLTPELRPLPLDADVAAARADAVLLIGDRAIHPPVGVFVETWDLGQAWCEWAGLPFVFAMWTARRGVNTASLDRALRRARDSGLENLESIAARDAAPAGLSTEACLVYLRDNLHFCFGREERRGLELFARLAGEIGMSWPRQRVADVGLECHGCETP
jgi:chorismate dehydratase